MYAPFTCACFLQGKAGPVLIAINPFKDVQCYGNDFVTAYREKLFDNPHVFAIADTAYNEMMRGELNGTWRMFRKNKKDSAFQPLILTN